MNNLIRLSILLLLMVVGITPDAFAGEESEIFDQLASRATVIGVGLRDSGFIIAGFGLVFFSFMAIFNKISWKTLAYIMLSCFILSTMFWYVMWVAEGSKGGVPDLQYDVQGEGAVGGGTWLQQIFQIIVSKTM